jgi:histidine triad (HIT) family protein
VAYDRDNPFARILRGELPAHRVCEDEHTLAFMDIMPQTRGHTLVIPKAEAETIFDLEPALLTATILSTRRVALAVRAAFSPEGMMIGQLNGSMAGQTVFHLHFHVIPRYEPGGFRFHGKPAEDSAVLAEHAAAIRAHLPA